MMRILFVDDDRNILDGLRRTLRPLRTEMEAEFVDCGSRALALLDNGAFDVVVTDMRMPGMDGMTLLRQVATRHPHVLRIVLSGHSEMEAEVRSAGIAHHYFSKPCSFGQLKTALQSVLEDNKRGSTKTVESKWEISPEVQELIPFFLNRRRADLEAIKQLLAEGNFEGICLLAHSIKGSSPSYGFPELGQLGAQIEQAALCRNTPLIEKQTGSLGSLLSVLGSAS